MNFGVAIKLCVYGRINNLFGKFNEGPEVWFFQITPVDIVIRGK